MATYGNYTEIQLEQPLAVMANEIAEQVYLLTREGKLTELPRVRVHVNGLGRGKVTVGWTMEVPNG